MHAILEEEEGKTQNANVILLVTPWSGTHLSHVHVHSVSLHTVAHILQYQSCSSRAREIVQERMFRDYIYSILDELKEHSK